MGGEIRGGLRGPDYLALGLATPWIFNESAGRPPWAGELVEFNMPNRFDPEHPARRTVRRRLLHRQNRQTRFTQGNPPHGAFRRCVAPVVRQLPW